MKDPQILSIFQGPGPTHGADAATRPLVFDACQVSVILRAVLYVETVLAVALMYAASDFSEWMALVAIVTGGALPATLLWLVIGCAAKRQIARLPLAGQYAAGMALGALAGLYACGMLSLAGLFDQARWLASAFTGAALAAGLVAALAWRVRGQLPATTKARLAQLQSSIRPHFLFNTLNTAIALVRQEPAKAEMVLEDLAELFRHALIEHEGNSTLDQELTLARRYLEIEQVRFGERLRIEWALDERAHGARLPPLILQPLVENAVKHGVEPSATGAELRISTELKGQMAIIEISNTMPAGEGRRGHGIALANVRDRLNLLHDIESSFHAAMDGEVYLARIEVPMPGWGV
ncbi:sensor histidine kinase [Ottowia thiooxydans]|uniref:sensor histidine kinase n=1 Tax=Ottowia thiooxydans TaxID=219182 RepID=UPI0004038E40|nr:histidine kinase [Ottowia thiooxydans]